MKSQLCKESFFVVVKYSWFFLPKKLYHTMGTFIVTSNIFWDVINYFLKQQVFPSVWPETTQISWWWNTEPDSTWCMHRNLKMFNGNNIVLELSHLILSIRDKIKSSLLIFFMIYFQSINPQIKVRRALSFMPSTRERLAKPSKKWGA